MKGEDKSKRRLPRELAERCQQIAELEEASKTRRQRAEELFRSLFINSPIGIYIVQDGKFRLVNPQFQKHTGYSEEELSGMDPLGLVLPEDRDKVRENAVRMLKGEHSSPHEYRILTKEGELRWIVETVVSIQYQGKRATLGYYMDITEHKRAEEALEEAERRFRSLAQSAVDAIISADSQGNIVFWNRGAQTIFGYSEEEALGKPLTLLMPERYKEAHRKAMERLSLTGDPRLIGKTVELRGLRKDGGEFPLEVSLSSWKTGKGTFYTAIIRDITERKQAEDTIRQLAYHDPLTGLPNRLLFHDRLCLALAHARRNQHKLAVMLLDLDRFKSVNDALGHNGGDQLLQAAGERLTRLLRKSDTVARMGGDEFLLLFPEISRVEDTVRIAQKILEAFRKPFTFNGSQLQVTTSIGIALYPDDGEDADTLVRNADIALYRAKEQGRDNYQRYTPPHECQSPGGAGSSCLSSYPLLSPNYLR